QLMERFAGVRLEVRASEADGLLGLISQMRRQDAERAALHDRALVLADLVALRQVGVEVVLAREDRAPVDRAADRKAKADGVLDRGAIQHGEHAGKRDVDRGRLRIWRGAERCGGGRKDL